MRNFQLNILSSVTVVMFTLNKIPIRTHAISVATQTYTNVPHIKFCEVIVSNWDILLLLFRRVPSKVKIQVLLILDLWWVGN